MPLPSADSYRAYEQEHTYSSDLGYLVLPIAQRTPGWRRIRLHGGLAFRKVKWSATRFGLPPVIPRADDLGTDLILSHTICPALPTPNPDHAGYNWTITGEYVYLQGDPREIGVDSFPTGGFPFPIAPNDVIASGLVDSPPADASLNLANVTDSSNPSNDLVIRLGEEAIAGDLYSWPFTSLAPSFSDQLFGE